VRRCTQKVLAGRQSEDAIFAEIVGPGIPGRDQLTFSLHVPILEGADLHICERLAVWIRDTAGNDRMRLQAEVDALQHLTRRNGHCRPWGSGPARAVLGPDIAGPLGPDAITTRRDAGHRKPAGRIGRRRIWGHFAARLSLHDDDRDSLDRFAGCRICDRTLHTGRSGHFFRGGLLGSPYERH
jgi:hypothetical protein